MLKPCSRTTRSTTSRVCGETSGRPLITRETVAIETPAARAISRIVALDWSPLPSLRAILAFKHNPTGNGYGIAAQIEKSFLRQPLDFGVTKC